MTILELKLATNHPLAELADFYTNLLAGVPTEQTQKRLELQIGSSQLTFNFVESPQPSRYHFAINIPKNQFEEARDWLSKRVPLTHSNDGEHVFHSEDWNADSVYFYDSAGNILELIARHTLNNESEAPFGVQSLLNISEVGIAADDVVEQIATIQKHIDVEPYKSGSATFTPVGDENGLFIVVKQGRIWFPDTSISADQLPVTVIVEQAGQTAKLFFS